MESIQNFWSQKKSETNLCRNAAATEWFKSQRLLRFAIVGFGKGVFWKRGLFRKVHFLEILENLEILEILENPQTVENKGESGHFLEILEI